MSLPDIACREKERDDSQCDNNREAIAGESFDSSRNADAERHGAIIEKCRNETDDDEELFHKLPRILSGFGLTLAGSKLLATKKGTDQ